MKTLKKINKGLILTIFVLLILIIYLIAVEAKRNSEKPYIEKACEEYIEITNKYLKVPEESKKIYDKGNIENLDEQKNIEDNLNKKIEENMKKLEKELKDKMIDNELATKMQKEVIEDYAKSHNDAFNSIVTDFDREITKIKKFDFNENQVTVTFDSKTEVETRYLGIGEENLPKEFTKKDVFNSQNDVITLQKVDGIWKVVYASLQYYSYESSYINTTMVKL